MTQSFPNIRRISPPNVMRNWQDCMARLLSKKIHLEIDIHLMATPNKDLRDAAIHLFLKELEQALSDSLLRRMLKDSIHTVRFRATTKPEREVLICQNVLEVLLPITAQSSTYKTENRPSLYQILLQIS